HHANDHHRRIEWRDAMHDAREQAATWLRERRLVHPSREKIGQTTTTRSNDDQYVMLGQALHIQWPERAEFHPPAHRQQVLQQGRLIEPHVDEAAGLVERAAESNRRPHYAHVHCEREERRMLPVTDPQLAFAPTRRRKAADGIWQPAAANLLRRTVGVQRR